MIIGAGTPNRLYELLVNGKFYSEPERSETEKYLGALSAKALRRIVFDASHIDQKNRGLFNMNAVTTDVMKLLGLQVLKEKYGKEDGIELIFF